MTENWAVPSPEIRILETLYRLADDTGNLEIYEKQLRDQLGEEAIQWDVHLLMLNLKESGSFMGKPYFKNGDEKGSYYSIILRNEKRFPKFDNSTLRYE
jgi:hypothetical protein